MTIRTTARTVTFTRPFSIGSADVSFSPGDYLVETDEEMIENLSFPAWRRVATTIHVRTDGATQVLPIDPRRLDLMLARDSLSEPTRTGEGR
jgi:hypothetical protein